MPKSIAETRKIDDEETGTSHWEKAIINERTWWWLLLDLVVTTVRYQLHNMYQVFIWCLIIVRQWWCLWMITKSHNSKVAKEWVSKKHTLILLLCRSIYDFIQLFCCCWLAWTVLKVFQADIHNAYVPGSYIYISEKSWVMSTSKWEW